MATLRPGDRVLARGRLATYVKLWGAGAVVRFDDRPEEPKVVPLRVLERVDEEDRKATR
ncbi:MAG: hypothetical protein JO073_01925 [Actinobacteria bacterium]|nr:hypothetical protein [Actinomycetota bacterium]